MTIELGSEQSPVSQSVESCIKLATAFLVVVLIAGWSCYSKGRKGKLPPGPFPLPIIGNLHMLGKLPHRSLAALSKKYGPLMSLRLGSALTLVVSSPEMAMEFLKTHDQVFARRSPTAAIKHLSYNFSGLLFSPYGPQWRQMRKVCILQLLSAKRLDYFRFIREEEVSAMVCSILHSDNSRPLSITQIVSTLGMAIICRMGFSRKYSDQELRAFHSLDILLAGSDTAATITEWALSEVLKNPSVLRKLQQELEDVVGFGRIVCESDLPRLVYLQAVVKETLRLHPQGPILFRHLSAEACDLLGYEIPQNTRVLVNSWAIGRNTNSWENAERFQPERFMEGVFSEVDANGDQTFDWLPFGAGRRGCPGQQLGTLVAEFGVAQLLHCFNWKLPLEDVNGQNQELNMTEVFNGITTPRAQELFATPTPRLDCIAHLK